MDSTPPSFEDAAVYVLLPEHVQDADVATIADKISEVLGKEAPLILVSGSGTESQEEFLPAAAVLRVVGPPLAKATISAASRVIKDSYNDNRAAKAHFDNRAANYNASADRWWAQQMGRA